MLLSPLIEKGTLWAAFQTSGVASAEPSNGYSRWNVVQTKWYWDTLQRVRQPFEARGKGLPSNFCNAICAESGWIWVGTNSGLGYSKNKTDWNFLRGRDYGAKNEDYGNRMRKRLSGMLKTLENEP
mgnify:CR=1 FL=1